MMRLLIVLILVASPVFAAKKPDVVFIVIDDLNDWIGVMGGHPQSKTPNLDARTGTPFSGQVAIVWLKRLLLGCYTRHPESCC